VGGHQGRAEAEGTAVCRVAAADRVPTEGQEPLADRGRAAQAVGTEGAGPRDHRLVQIRAPLVTPGHLVPAILKAVRVIPETRVRQVARALLPRAGPTEDRIVDRRAPETEAVLQAPRVDRMEDPPVALADQAMADPAPVVPVTLVGHRAMVMATAVA
jgi:hypothetical protein